MRVFAPPAGKSLAECRTRIQTVRVDGVDLEAPVYERLELPEHTVIVGPAILEQPDSTIFIDPDLEGRVDPFGNIIITRQNGRNQ